MDLDPNMTDKELEAALFKAHHDVFSADGFVAEDAWWRVRELERILRTRPDERLRRRWLPR
jgi:hypothetical protein